MQAAERQVGLICASQVVLHQVLISTPVLGCGSAGLPFNGVDIAQPTFEALRLTNPLRAFHQ